MNSLKKRLNCFLEFAGVDALVLASGDAAREFDPNFYYFSGCELDNSIIVLKEKEQVMLVSELNFELAKERFSGRVEKFERGKAWEKALEFLREEKKVGLNFDFVSIRSWKKMKRLRRKAIDASRQLLEMRAVKYESEVVELKKAAGITKRILRKIEGEMKIGRTEKQVASELEVMALTEGGEVSFEPIVSFGRNTRFPHSKPTDKKLARGENALVDFGVRVNGYCSDLTRSYFLSGGSDAEKAYEKLKEIVEEVVCLIRPGVEARKAAELANELLLEAGHPKMIHSLGHGIGLQVHESPRIGLKSKDVLRNRMAFTLEPAVYTKKFGVRFEEDFLLEKKAKLL